MVSSGSGVEKSAAKDAFLKEWEGVGLSASSADYYFNSYNHYGVHEDILKDEVTISAYQKAIQQNAHLFRGAVVLDVGCGLGLLSLLAAQAGARKVIGLEEQSELVSMAGTIAQANGFGDIIQFVCGSATPGAQGHVTELPDGLVHVDIIVSEWMGYFLMYESRLGEVLTARDRWLKPGGLLFPDRAKLHVEMLEDAEYAQRHFDYFDNVWGFDFAAMKVSAHSEPVVQAFEPRQLLTSSTCVLDLDLYRCTPADCYQMAAPFTVACARPGHVHGSLFWFEIRFDACHKPVAFATGPESPPTCWKQVAFFLGGSPITVKTHDRIHGMVAIRRLNEEKRDLDIKISFRLGSDEPRVHCYRWS